MIWLNNRHNANGIDIERVPDGLNTHAIAGDSVSKITSCERSAAPIAEMLRRFETGRDLGPSALERRETASGLSRDRGDTPSSEMKALWMKPVEEVELEVEVTITSIGWRARIHMNRIPSQICWHSCRELPDA